MSTFDNINPENIRITGIADDEPELIPLLTHEDDSLQPKSTGSRFCQCTVYPSKRHTKK